MSYNEPELNKQEVDSAQSSVSRNHAHSEIITPPEFFNDVIVLGVGTSKKDKNFGNTDRTYGKWIDRMSTFEVGPKDGSCILQGRTGGLRGSKTQLLNSIMLVDVDNGTSILSSVAKMRDWGLHALFYTTSSNGTNKSMILEQTFVKYVKGLDAKIDVLTLTPEQRCKFAQKYLLEVKRYVPQLFEGVEVTELPSKPGDNGKELYFTHQRMQRHRIMFKLKNKFDFFEVGTIQSAQIDKWKAIYAGVCSTLDIPYDTSCVDPARLMYWPRIPKGSKILTGGGAEINEEDTLNGHCIFVIDGLQLDLDQFQPVHKTGAVKVATPRVAFNRVPGVAKDARDCTGFKTKHLEEFAGKYPLFLATQFFEQTKNDDEISREVESGKREFTCPNGEVHSQHNDSGSSFVVWDADGTEPWRCWCQSQTCIAQSSHDRRFFFFDKWCQAHGIDDALDERVLRHCPAWLEEQEQKRAVEAANTEALATLRARAVALKGNRCVVPTCHCWPVSSMIPGYARRS